MSEEAAESNIKQDKNPKNADKENDSDKGSVPARDYNELKEKFLRVAAEFDNYKKRTAQDVENAKNLGKAEMLKSLLNVIDEFDLTFAAAIKSQDKNLSKGIELLYSNFTDALKKQGLKEIETNGTFDPYKHEIIMMEEDKSKDGTIISVVKKGYTFNDKLLRAAHVIVSKHQEQENNSKKKDDANKK